MMLSIARPASGEYADFYGGYIARVADSANAIQDLVKQRERVSALLNPLSDAQAAFRYAPEKWSVREVVGHMADVERIFGYRLLRIARGDGTPLPGFDENAYVRLAGSDARALGDIVAEWVAVRNATIALVQGLPPAGWERLGTANGSPISARALFYIIAGHVEHHCEMLRTRYGVTL
jgi:hypothetical protein